MLEEKQKIIGKPILSSRIADSLKKKKHSISKTLVELMIDQFFDEITNAMIKNEEVRLLGYCSFKKVKTSARTAMNLKTSQKIVVPAKFTPKIKFSLILKEKIAKER